MRCEEVDWFITIQEIHGNPTAGSSTNAHHAVQRATERQFFATWAEINWNKEAEKIDQLQRLAPRHVDRDPSASEFLQCLELVNCQDPPTQYKCKTKTKLMKRDSKGHIKTWPRFSLPLSDIQLLLLQQLIQFLNRPHCNNSLVTTNNDHHWTPWVNTNHGECGRSLLLALQYLRNGICGRWNDKYFRVDRCAGEQVLLYAWPFRGSEGFVITQGHVVAS